MLKLVPGGFDARGSVKTCAGDDIGIWSWVRWPREKLVGE